MNDQVKEAISNWWLTTRFPKSTCPSCGRSGHKHDPKLLPNDILLMICAACGHAVVFDFDKIKKEIGLP